MAPSEASILEQFLLAPAQLPAVLPLDDFAALFPRPLRTSPLVRALYRDLQRQRNAVLEAVAADIDAEVARGRLLRRHALRARLRAAAQEDAAADDELLLERFVAAAAAESGPKDKSTQSIPSIQSTQSAQSAQGTRGGTTAPASSLRSLPAMVAELDAAAQDLEADLQLLDEEEARLRQTVQHAVGRLSDLRYGRLANPQLRDQVLDGLQAVQAACETLSPEARTAPS